MNTALDKRQTATILAALRYWQREGLMSSGHEQDIATEGNSMNALDAEDIDALCEQINVAQEPAIIVVGCEGGLVTGASSNVEGLTMIVLDYDIEGGHGDNLIDVPDPDTDNDTQAASDIQTIWHKPEWVQQIVTAVGLKDTTGKPLELAGGAAQDSGNCRALLESVHEELEGMGFGTDQSIDGGDCCEYLGRLFVDVGEALERDGAKVAT
jgi:hypothetical protein